MKHVEHACAIAVVATIVSCPWPAFAAESISPAGPIGGTDIRSAFLPPPGNYIAGVAGGINVQKWYNGNSDPMNADGHVYFAGAGLLHVYDRQFLSGSLGSTLYMGVQRTCFGFARVSCASGLQDIYSDVLAWSRFNPSEQFTPGNPMPYGTAYWVGLGMNVPTGNYDKHRSPNIGSNFYTVSPNVGVTYTTPSVWPVGLAEATELSARLFFNYYTKNRDSGYQSGYVVSLDFAATQRNGPWQYGITGTTYQQLDDDRLNGSAVANEGSRAASFSIGPLLAYDFSIDGKRYNLMAKFLSTTWGENTTGVSGLTLRLATKF